MAMEQSEAKNQIFTLLYNNRAFVKALPIGPYIATNNGVEFPSARKGDSYCYLHFSDAVINELNALNPKLDINFAAHSCHVTVFANKDFDAPPTTKPTQCHFTFKYTLNQQPQELRVYYATDGELLLKDCSDPDKAKGQQTADAIMNLPYMAKISHEFSNLLAKLYSEKIV